MSEARWGEVVALFEQALDQPPSEREQFLDRSTADDPELRALVSAMLRADSAEHPLLDAPPGRLAVALHGVAARELEGQRVGPYTLVREIGRGGMATVYLAHDAKHARSVALKVLDSGASSALGGERFRREIEVVAQLQHPHILPLYDSGRIPIERAGADGGGSGELLFYVMPLVGGETLRDRISREGRLPVADVRRIVEHVGAAVDYAHRHGVVHRDVKPANILLDDEHAMVADFGIAHRALGDVRAELTAPGVMVGTPAYMSPEQARGDTQPDARSDVYSLACVVFEMLTGHPPFRESAAAAVIAAHLRERVPSARAERPELPKEVDAVLARAMAKNPAERFGSVRELVRALDGALEGAPASLGGATPGVDGVPGPRQGRPRAGRLRRRRLAAGAGAAAILALGAWGASRLVSSRAEADASIAVLPFVNMSNDPANEYFSDGISEELTGALAQLGRVRVAPRTAAFAYKGRTGDIRRIGEELGVSRILEGSVRRDGDRVLILASLYDAGSGERLWVDRYERDWSTVLQLQTEIAGAIADQLQLSLLAGERRRLAERHPVNAAAYDSYLRGRHFFDQRTAASLEQAVVHFRRALALDSMYARAHAGLADTYSILAWTGAAAPNELFTLAERSARHAVALDSALAEGHVSLGIIHTFHDWDWPAADRAFARAIALDSSLASAWYFRTWPLVAAGRIDEAMATLQRARQLEPLSLITNARIATILSWMRRDAEADSVLRRTLEIDPTYPVARVQLARVHSIRGRHAEAIAALPPDSVRLGSYESGIAGFVHARAGHRARALAAAHALEGRDYIPAEGVAAIYAGLGDRDRAFASLQRAIEARGVGLIFFGAEPMYDTLRDDPRYEAVVRRIGLVR